MNEIRSLALQNLFSIFPLDVFASRPYYLDMMTTANTNRAALLGTIIALATSDQTDRQVATDLTKALIAWGKSFARTDATLAQLAASWLNVKGTRHLTIGQLAARAEVVATLL